MKLMSRSTLDDNDNDNVIDGRSTLVDNDIDGRSTLADNDNDNDIDGRSPLADNDRRTRGLMEESWNYQLRQHSSAN